MFDTQAVALTTTGYELHGLTTRTTTATTTTTTHTVSMTASNVMHDVLLNKCSKVIIGLCLIHIQLQLQSPYIITYCDYGRGARIHYKS